MYDEWGFDDETQLLAEAGYAVLRVNYRGSGNYGRKFRNLGARQWGGTMQDDLTDATRWAIDQGIADGGADLHLRRQLRRLRGADGRGEGAGAVPLRGRLRRRLRHADDVHAAATSSRQRRRRTNFLADALGGGKAEPREALADRRSRTRSRRRCSCAVGRRRRARARRSIRRR